MYFFMKLSDQAECVDAASNNCEYEYIDTGLPSYSSHTFTFD